MLSADCWLGIGTVCKGGRKRPIARGIPKPKPIRVSAETWPPNFVIRGDRVPPASYRVLYIEPSGTSSIANSSTCLTPSCAAARHCAYQLNYQHQCRYICNQLNTSSSSAAVSVCWATRQGSRRRRGGFTFCLVPESFASLPEALTGLIALGSPCSPPSRLLLGAQSVSLMKSKLFIYASRGHGHIVDLWGRKHSMVSGSRVVC